MAHKLITTNNNGNKIITTFNIHQKVKKSYSVVILRSEIAHELKAKNTGKISLLTFYIMFNNLFQSYFNHPPLLITTILAH